MILEIDIGIAAEGWSAVPDLDGLVRRSVTAAAAEAGFGEPAEVSVLLCDDAAIRTLNRRFRGQDKPTNVLSFPAANAPHPGAPRLLGDIAVAYETMWREAAEEHKPPGAHLAHLLVHGVLHLLDHDHEAEADAEAMEDLERRILGRLGYPDPYAGTTPQRAVAP